MYKEDAMELATIINEAKIGITPQEELNFQRQIFRRFSSSH